LHKGRSGSRIASAADASIPVHPSALVGHWRQTDIAGKLLAVAERSVEHLAHQHGRKVLADAADAAQGGDLLAGGVIRRRFECCGALGIKFADQLHRQHEAATQPVDEEDEHRRGAGPSMSSAAESANYERVETTVGRVLLYEIVPPVVL